MRRVAAMGQVTFETASAEETFRLGEALGRQLRGGEFIGLIGELGAGKTQLVRGIAQGAGVKKEEVASPTFAIVYPYATARGFTLHHADLYRLADEDELYATGFFDLIGGSGAMLVEWLEKVPSAAPADHLRIELNFVQGALDQRKIVATTTGPSHEDLLRRWRGIV